MKSRNTSNTLSVIGLGLFFVILILAGCNQVSPKTPDINDLLTGDSDVSFYLDTKSISTTETSFGEQLILSLPQLGKILDQSAVSIIEAFKFEAKDLARVGGYINGYETIKNPKTDSQKSWLVAADFNQYIPGNLLIKKINSSENWNLVAVELNKINQFQIIEISSADGLKLTEIALFSGRTSQIRVGDTETLRQSLTSRKGKIESAIRDDMKMEDHQLWIHCNIPDDINNQIKNIETRLPFEPGTLISGFKTAMISAKTTDDSIHTSIAMEFDSFQQANTAFSYIQLAMNFVGKPYARRATKGKAKNFIKSIHNYNQRDLVFINASIQEEELNALAKLHKNKKAEELLNFFFDLIK